MEEGKCVTNEELAQERANDNSFKGKLLRLKDNKTRVFINGKGVGKIDKIDEDNIEFSIVRKEEKTRTEGKGKDKKTIEENVYFKETIIFPYNKITDVTEGEKELPKSDADKQLDADLEGL